MPHAHAVLRLTPAPIAARSARRYLRDECAAHLADDVIATAALLLSELVTNACQHGAGTITVAIACDGPAIRIAVTDASPDGLTRRRAAPEAEQGRGLQIVATLAAAWGVRAATGADDPGKTVWFRVQPQVR